MTNYVITLMDKVMVALCVLLLLFIGIIGLEIDTARKECIIKCQRTHKLSKVIDNQCFCSTGSGWELPHE